MEKYFFLVVIHYLRKFHYFLFRECWSDTRLTLIVTECFNTLVNYFRTAPNSEVISFNFIFKFSDFFCSYDRSSINNLQNSTKTYWILKGWLGENWGSPCNNRLGARDIFRFSVREVKCRKSIVPEKIFENEGKKIWAYRISKKAQIMFKQFFDLTCHLRNKKYNVLYKFDRNQYFFCAQLVKTLFFIDKMSLYFTHWREIR